MRKVTLRSLWGHKRRLVSTIVSVVLGVAFMAGTLIFSDTIDRAFEDLFAQTNEEVDTVVQGDVLFSSQFGGESRQTLDPALLEQVRAVEGVERAEPYSLLVTFSAQLLDTEGDPVGVTQGPPTLVESWIEDEVLNPYDLVDGGREPTGPDEIALNVAAADDGGYEVGDTVSVYTQQGTLEFTLVGIFKFGTAESSGGAVSLDFTLERAAELGGTPGRISNVFARAADGVSDTELTARIAAVIPESGEALTGRAYASQTASSVSEGFGFITQILVVFAGIALLVGSFIIYNTFQILLAQRTRELALLRAVGASRRQILTSVLLEAIVIATFAAGLGVLVGILLAKGVLSALSSANGGDLATDGTALVPATLLNCFLRGFVVTIIAAFVPAIRATRVPPLAAMREVAVDRSNASKLRLAAGVIVLLLAGFNLSKAWGADSTDVVGTVAFGGMLAIVGAIVLGPTLATPTIRVLGGWLPRLRGITGRLAQENAARSPKRTSATASALVIAVALIGFINVVAASATQSIEGRVTRGFSADLYILGRGGFGPPVGFSSDLATELAALPDVDLVTAQQYTEGQVTYADGAQSLADLGSVEPDEFSELADIEMAEGDLTDLDDTGIVVDRQNAESHGVAIGDTLTLTYPGGAEADLEVQAISDDLVALFPFTITGANFTAHVPEALDFFVFARLADGADLDDVLTRAGAIAEDYPNVDVLDQDEFIGSVAGQITTFVTLIQALLGLSIIIAFIGIANTLSLSIHERTREIGLLRAVGATRPQLRATMRWEAVIIALLGTVVGLGLGLVVSRAVIEALGPFGLSDFVVPFATLITIVVVAGAVSILASILPARRAARLDVLAAISQD